MKVKVIAKADLDGMIAMCKKFPGFLNNPFELEIDCGYVTFSTAEEFMEFVRLQVQSNSGDKP